MRALAVFIAYPWAALLVAFAFGAVWIVRRRRIVAVCAVVWAGYGLYEWLHHIRVLCSGECNIRVDLLLLYPALMLLSCWGTAVALFAGRRS